MSMGDQRGPRVQAPAQKASEPAALKDGVGQIAEGALVSERSFVESAKAQTIDFIDRRKDDAAESVADLARSLRESSKPFDDRPNIRAFFDSAADGLDQLAGSIRERSTAEIYEEMETIVRQR